MNEILIIFMTIMCLIIFTETSIRKIIFEIVLFLVALCILLVRFNSILIFYSLSILIIYCSALSILFGFTIMVLGDIPAMEINMFYLLPLFPLIFFLNIDTDSNNKLTEALELLLKIGREMTKFDFNLLILFQCIIILLLGMISMFWVLK